jgi:hypothetical protein
MQNAQKSVNVVNKENNSQEWQGRQSSGNTGQLMGNHKSKNNVNSPNSNG